MGMPGHLGDERVTVQNLQVMQVRETEKVILISGAVPGANGSFVVIRPALKKTGGEGAAATVAATPSSQEGAAK
jgi:large subunit ribosomal protein L3